MTTFRRLRNEGRKAGIAALVLALVTFAATGLFLVSATAEQKPTAPKILTSPHDPTTSTSATFTFSSSQSGVTFKCSRDGAAFTTCTSGITYTGLAVGHHVFSVEAVKGSSISKTSGFDWDIVPPAPTIVNRPTNPTGATSASFTYTGTPSGVNFKCALDGASFKSCASSGVSYTGLGGGGHKFQVKAQVGSGPLSDAASYTWLIDKNAPAISVSFPADDHFYNAAAWAAGCSPVGVCGTASDPAGVQSVAVAIKKQSNGKYWNGSSFTASSIVFNNATGTTAWKYAIARPADGDYTLYARATDDFGNTTSNSKLTSSDFTVDTVAPAAPVITKKPSSPSNDKSPKFEYSVTTYPASFTCKLDSGALTECDAHPDHHGRSSALGDIKYNNLAPGPHCFAVFATDAANNVGPTTTYCWTVSGVVPASAINVFSGSPQDAALGANFAAPLVAKVTNAASSPVSGVQVTFAAPSSGASGTFSSPCSGTTCIVTTNASGLATAPTFKANGTAGGYVVTATATGVSTPANFSLVNTAPFTITGNLAQQLAPGLTRTLDLSVTNPNPTAITIPAGGIAISIATGSGSCLAAANYSATSLGAPVIVPGNSTRLLSTLTSAGNLPSVSMIETGMNQDACKGLTLTLTYTGSATG